MSNNQEMNPLPNSESPIQRIEIEPEGPIDWTSALKELESADVPAKAPAPPPPPPVEETAAAKPKYIPRPPRKAPVIAEGTPPAEELSEVLTSVNSALNQLKRFEADHRHVIAPNIFRVWEDSLRETATVMTREFRRLRETSIDEPARERAVGEES